MDLLYNTVKSIIIYLILVTVVMNLLGNSTYKKYVGIFTGMILILFVVAPILKVLNMNNKLEYYLNLNHLTMENEKLFSDISIAQEYQKKEIMKGYKTTIREQVKEILSEYELNLTDIRIVIEEDETKEEYGKILSLSVNACLENKQEKSKNLIDKVTIDPIRFEEESKPIDYLETCDAKKDLVKFYDLNDENIEIIMQEN